MDKRLEATGRSELLEEVKRLRQENRELRDGLLAVLEGLKAATGDLPPAAQALLTKFAPPEPVQGLSMGALAHYRSCGVPGCGHQY